MAELEIPELPGRPLLEGRVKNYPKVQWLLDKYADKAYPIVDKHDIEAVLTELLDDMDRWKGAYKTMKINFNNECDSHAADNERNENHIKELEQIKIKYEFGKHFDQIHSFLFELDFWEITELIGEEFDRNFSFKSKNGCFVLNCKLVGNDEIYKIKELSKTDYFVECGFDTIFSELEKLEK